MTLSRRDNHGSHDMDACQGVFGNLMPGTFRRKTFEQAEALTSAISRTRAETDPVALARQYGFDHLEYSGNGNRVAAIID